MNVEYRPLESSAYIVEGNTVVRGFIIHTLITIIEDETVIVYTLSYNGKTYSRTSDEVYNLVDALEVLSERYT